jgi:hypothetical protein
MVCAAARWGDFRLSHYAVLGALRGAAAVAVFATALDARGSWRDDDASRHGLRVVPARPLAERWGPWLVRRSYRGNMQVPSA